MFLAPYYKYIYLIIIALYTNSYCAKYKNNSFLHKFKARDLSQALILLSFIVFFLATRPINRIFGDTTSYAEMYYSKLDNPFFFDIDAENLIFDNLFFSFSSIGLPISLFFGLIAFIYFGGMLQVCRQMFPRNTFMAFLVCLAAFSTFSYGVNGIKAGAATSIFLLAIAYKNNKILSIILALVSYGFHHSMIIPVGAYVLLSFVQNTSLYLVFWSFCLFCSIFHISFFQVLFAGFADEKGAEYLLPDRQSESAYITGFRLDFIIYSAVPVYLGYIMKYKKRYVSEFYYYLLNFYLITNGIWMLCMYASYTNRIAYLSWFIYPVLLIYPYLSNEKYAYSYKEFHNIVFGHLGFTLFMDFIFYNLTLLV